MKPSHLTSVLCVLLSTQTFAQNNPKKPVHRNPTPPAHHPAPRAQPPVPSPKLFGNVPPSPAAVFQSEVPMTGITLKAPLTDLFSKAVDRKTQASVQGSLILPNGKEIQDVMVNLRGSSSRLPSECTFHKLTLKFSKTAPKVPGNPFEGLNQIKIGTHCGETNDRSEIGRQKSTLEPAREALIYMALARIGVMSLLAREVQLTYLDTSSQPNPTNFPENPLTRPAFFLENESDAAKRYNASVVQKSVNYGEEQDTEVFHDADTNLDGASAVDMILAEVFASNSDWDVRFRVTNGDLSPNWNVNILKKNLSDPNNCLFSQVYDWDLSSWATARTYRRQTLSDNLWRLHESHWITKSVFDSERQKFSAAEADIHKMVDDTYTALSISGDAGQANIHQLIDAFYNEIEQFDSSVLPNS